MKKLYLMGALSLASMVAFAKKDEGGGADKTGAVADTTAAAEPVKTKSIVPSGWKSKDDELKKFIDGQCTGKEGFEMTAFFELCRKNGLAEEKVKHYEDLVNAKAHGIQGRAKMTLRNMLATPARKNGKLTALDGTEVSISIAKPAVSGAAAKAHEAAAEKEAGATA